VLITAPRFFLSTPDKSKSLAKKKSITGETFEKSHPKAYAGFINF